MIAAKWLNLFIEHGGNILTFKSIILVLFHLSYHYNLTLNYLEPTINRLKQAGNGYEKPGSGG